MNEVMMLKSGYARAHQNPDETHMYRAMTTEEAKLLQRGDHVPFQDLKGHVRNIKVNGAPKTWKRDPLRVEIPGKYGMYECATFYNRPDGTLRTISGALLLVRV